MCTYSCTSNNLKGNDHSITYYPVPSNFVCNNVTRPDPSKSDNKQYRGGYTIYLKDIERFRDKWNLFGKVSDDAA